MDIKTFLEFNKILPDGQARLLMGPAGIGKSAIVKQIAESRDYNFVDLRLSELEPSDLVGLPYLTDDPENGEKVTNYAKPWWWPETGNTVLFLDEVDRCREDMQPIAMQLTLDRRAGGRNLPDGVIVFAACNGEKYMTSAIDQALVNRFAVVELQPTSEEWLVWAENNKVHPAVTGFIRSDKHMLDTPEKMIGVPNQAVPTRRSWTNLGYALNILEEQMQTEITNHEYLHLFAQPFVGLNPGISFASWVKEKYQVIRPADIFSGKIKAKNLNIVQVANVVQEVADLFLDEKRTEKEQYNCLKFFMDAGHEAFAALFSALDREAAYIIEKFDDVDKFIKDNVNVLSQHVAPDSENS